MLNINLGELAQNFIQSIVNEEQLEIDLYDYTFPPEGDNI